MSYMAEQQTEERLDRRAHQNKLKGTKKTPEKKRQQVAS